MAKVVSFSNQKGGVGKTTSCVNIAAQIANKGKKVLMIDMDPQGNAGATFGVEVEKGQNSIYEVLLGEISIKEATYSSVQKNVDVIPSNVDLSAAEVDLVYVENREKVLKEALKQVKEQ